jgi:5'(3')-deoxyribonucleotidase
MSTRDPNAILYSDADGVLVDFIKGAEKVLGHAWEPPHGHHDHPTKNEKGLLVNQHEKFWETLPEMPDFTTLWRFLEKYQPNILTAVPSWPHDFAEVEHGKRAWFRRHIPSLPQRRIYVVHREDKAQYATSGRTKNILIDDHVKNVQEFTAAGGIGILHHNAKSTIILLKNLGYH